MLAVSSQDNGGQKMFTYYLAKAHQDQLLGEAKLGRLTREAKQAKMETGKTSHRKQDAGPIDVSAQLVPKSRNRKRRKRR